MNNAHSAKLADSNVKPCLTLAYLPYMAVIEPMCRIRPHFAN